MTIDSDELLAKVELARRSGQLSKMVTSAKIRYSASIHDDLIEEFNADTGERKLGKFTNGVFIPIEEE